LLQYFSTSIRKTQEIIKKTGNYSAVFSAHHSDHFVFWLYFELRAADGGAKSYQFIIFGKAFQNRLWISEGAFHIGNSSMCYVLLYCILHKLRSDLHRQRSTIV